MAFFNEFPNTRTYDKDLGWLIHVVGQLQIEVKTFIENNTINIPDQITWDITKQYTRNTLVIDYDGTAYLSKQPVPVGIAITNTDYWMPIFNYDDSINTLRDNIAANEQNHTTATAERHAGDLVWLQNALYKVTADMPAGTAYIIGTNVELYTIEDYLLFLKGAIAAEAQARQDADAALQGNIDAEALVRQGADNTLQGNIDAEALARQGADNTLQGNIDALAIKLNRNVYNVDDYGATGDGTTDDYAAILAAYNAMGAGDVLYFPPKSYKWNTMLSLAKPITILFNHSTIVCGAATSQILADDDLTILGSASIVGDANRRLVLLPNNKHGFIMDAKMTVSGFSNMALVTGERYDDVTIRGEYTTSDSMIILLNGCSNVEICGIRATYTTSPTLGTIVLTESVHSHTYSNVHIHDNFIDGGGVLNNGAITVTRSEQTEAFSGNNFLSISNVIVEHNTVKNCPNPTDGLDVLFCNYAKITGNTVENCFEGIAVLCNASIVSHNNVSSCLSAGIVIGDPTIGANGTNWTSLTISDNILIGNGSGTGQYVIAASIGSVQPSTCYCATIYMSNNLMIGAPYGIYFGNNSGGSNIVGSNNFIYGTTAPLHTEAGQLGQFNLNNNPGYNPPGRITSIADPTDTTPVTNNYGGDVEVFLINGTTAQGVAINGVQLAYLDANDNMSVILKPGMSINFVTDVTGCHWNWFAL